MPSMETSNKSERAHVRKRVAAEVEFSLARSGLAGLLRRRPRLGRIEDISKSGARFVTDERLEPGAVLTLRLRFPERETTTRLGAFVRWVQPAGEVEAKPAFAVGVEFAELRPRAVALLQEALR